MEQVVNLEKLGLKVMPAHKRALQQMAQAEGEPVAVIVRRLIRVEAERCGLWQPACAQSGIEDLPHDQHSA